MAGQDYREKQADGGVVTLLIAQHSMIRDLFAEVKRTRDAEQRETFERLVRLLAVHETAEEEVVHPLSRQQPGGDGVVDDRLAEERQAKEMLQRLEEIGPGGAGFEPLLEELRIAVLTHARAEERYEFVQLQHRSSPEHLSRLATVVRSAEAVAPTHPHPGAESATANLVMGPFLAVSDRVRDAVRKVWPG